MTAVVSPIDFELSVLKEKVGQITQSELEEWTDQMSMEEKLYISNVIPLSKDLVACAGISGHNSPNGWVNSTTYDFNISNIADLWTVVNNYLNNPANLEAGIFFFKNGLEPTYEKLAKSGYSAGSFIAIDSKELEVLIHNQFVYLAIATYVCDLDPNYVVGIEIKSSRLSIWTVTHDKTINNHIENTMRKSLDKFGINYLGTMIKLWKVDAYGDYNDKKRIFKDPIKQWIDSRKCESAEKNVDDEGFTILRKNKKGKMMHL